MAVCKDKDWKPRICLVHKDKSFWSSILVLIILNTIEESSGFIQHDEPRKLIAGSGELDSAETMWAHSQTNNTDKLGKATGPDFFHSEL